MGPLSYYQSRKIIQSFTVIALASSLKLLIHPTNAYLDINQYCKAWDINFRPIICILKNGTQTAPPNYHPPHQHPPRPTQFPILMPDYTDFDDDDECSCEVTCTPRIVNQRNIQSRYYLHFIPKKRFKRTTSTSYRCRSCGTECPVSTTRQPTCNCVVPATKSECTCTATCATFRYNPFDSHKHKADLDDANCILSVTALEDWRLGEERPPYICECKRSKAAESTTRPDFICICQRDPGDN